MTSMETCFSASDRRPLGGIFSIRETPEQMGEISTLAELFFQVLSSYSFSSCTVTTSPVSSTSAAHPKASDVGEADACRVQPVKFQNLI